MYNGVMNTFLSKFEQARALRLEALNEMIASFREEMKAAGFSGSVSFVTPWEDCDFILDDGVRVILGGTDTYTDRLATIAREYRTAAEANGVLSEFADAVRRV